MASTVDDSKAASTIDPPGEESKAASVVDPNTDIEKKQLNAGDEPTAAEQSNEVQRSISNTQWVFCCIGLYLAAFLYGKHIYFQ